MPPTTSPRRHICKGAKEILHLQYQAELKIHGILSWLRQPEKLLLADGQRYDMQKVYKSIKAYQKSPDEQTDT
jgi:hypothetical protein